MALNITSDMEYVHPELGPGHIQGWTLELYTPDCRTGVHSELFHLDLYTSQENLSGESTNSERATFHVQLSEESSEDCAYVNIMYALL